MKFAANRTLPKRIVGVRKRTKLNLANLGGLGSLKPGNFIVVNILDSVLKRKLLFHGIFRYTLKNENYLKELTG